MKKLIIVFIPIILLFLAGCKPASAINDDFKREEKIRNDINDVYKQIEETQSKYGL